MIEMEKATPAVAGHGLREADQLGGSITPEHSASHSPGAMPDRDDVSWPSLLAHANEVSHAYARALRKAKQELAEKDRAIDFYRRHCADLDRQRREAGA